MRSSARQARTVICDEALRLYAANGPDNVSLRQVAAAADVSPSLVIHHFGGKAGLREAVNERTTAALQRFAENVAHPGPDEAAGPGDDDFLPRLLVGFLPVDSPLTDYLCRQLMSDDQGGHRTFRRWHELNLARLDASLSEKDRTLRAAWLTVNQLGVLLLRHHLRRLLGRDPLDPESAARWAEMSADAYRSGSGN
ncbi:TetR/AcrR family transcriptional regulator [Actinomadura spongiicola]|uniref:TetR/AcrR family transcriptional regulator n=1 Tax=Actinomadura spongiicola TaxID=2303421 RepID=A0A372GA47_9ACTN|nr:TetR family transcriptional regulator [Actinomadura spongiicola]RFS82217.1 TetR/AcrR family transcriptional regulator [Actinomadura spongiicola]